MKMTKGSQPANKSGGMKAHLPPSPGNNPTTSRSPGCEFSSKNMPKGSSSARHHTAPNKTW